MKPLGPAGAAAPDLRAPVALIEAAPARNRIRFIAIGVFSMLTLLAARAVQLAFSGDPLAPAQVSAVAPVPRADIVDRNGVLLATTVRAYTLTATPVRAWDPQATIDALLRVFPDLDRAVTLRRLTDAGHDLVYLRRGLTPEEREQVLALGLAGIGFETESARTYPQGRLAAHVLGFTGVDLAPLAGIEHGLDAEIRAAGAEDRPVMLSLDVRMQYALETELDAAARSAGAAGGAALLLNARSGEVLALASWPAFDANDAARAPRDARLNRASGGVYELGSTMKPFTLAMALQEHVTTSGEVFDVSRPFEIDGGAVEDHEPILGPVTLRQILAHSSNIGAARLALRLGGARQRAYLERLGLTTPARLELGGNAAPIAPAAQSRRDVAAIGFGYGLAASPAALAGAYTVFANQGARVEPTLLARASDDGVRRTPVFSPEVARQLLGYMRAVVTEGTGRAADVPGLSVAGKTGTAEKFAAGGYDQSRNFSSFVGVFPSNDPRYVIVLALDDVGAGEAGGAVAAPAVAHTLRRIAPMLGLSVRARAAE
jgi:cell division protein FtsI (penicillin-binding protein 3)